MAFCLVAVYTISDGEKSAPIIGIGGNKIVSLANGEPRPNDEGWKMAYTDALGTALKSLGVASEIYEGNFDGSKYKTEPQPKMTSAHVDELTALIEEVVTDTIAFDKWLADNFKTASIIEIDDNHFNYIKAALEKKRGAK